jgi:putative transposase
LAPTHIVKRNSFDGQSALMLYAAEVRHIAGSKWGQKRYLNIDLLKDQELEGQIEVASA